MASILLTSFNGSSHHLRTRHRTNFCSLVPAKYLHKYRFHFNFEPLVSLCFKCGWKQDEQMEQKKVLFSRFGIKRKQRKENQVVAAKVFQFVCNAIVSLSGLTCFLRSHFSTLAVSPLCCLFAQEKLKENNTHRVVMKSRHAKTLTCRSNRLPHM